MLTKVNIYHLNRLKTDISPFILIHKLLDDRYHPGDIEVVGFNTIEYVKSTV